MKTPIHEESAATGTSLTIKEFIKHHYRHFNAAVLVDAAEALPRICSRAEKCCWPWPER